MDIILGIVLFIAGGIFGVIAMGLFAANNVSRDEHMIDMLCEELLKMEEQEDEDLS